MTLWVLRLQVLCTMKTIAACDRGYWALAEITRDILTSSKRYLVPSLALRIDSDSYPCTIKFVAVISTKFAELKSYLYSPKVAQKERAQLRVRQVSGRNLQ